MQTEPASIKSCVQTRSLTKGSVETEPTLTKTCVRSRSLTKGSVQTKPIQSFTKGKKANEKGGKGGGWRGGGGGGGVGALSTGAGTAWGAPRGHSCCWTLMSSRRSPPVSRA